MEDKSLEKMIIMSYFHSVLNSGSDYFYGNFSKWESFLLTHQIGNLRVVITKLPCVLTWVGKWNTKRLSGKK